MIGFIKQRIQSFGHAFRGLRDILKTEHNARVHACVTILALAISAWLEIRGVEFLLIIVVIALVWITEALNTVLEVVVDIVSPEYSRSAGRAKDLSAAAVLIAAIAALIVGIGVWVPALLVKLGF